LTEKVDGIRWKIEELDNQILDLIKKRMEAALAMGKTKVEKALPVRDLRVEDQVMSRYSERASEVGISTDAAGEIAQILIRESVEAQARLPRPMGAERKVLVIGGAGQMGLWFARYMAMRWACGSPDTWPCADITSRSTTSSPPRSSPWSRTCLAP